MKIKNMLDCQLYMVRKMFLVSKRLFFSTLIRAVFQGLFPAVELICFLQAFFA